MNGDAATAATTAADGIQRVAVIGLGTMGHGIAQCFAMAGYQVAAYDDYAPARAALHERVRASLAAFVGAGLLAADAVEPVLARITVADTLADAVADAQFVTEAVKEDLAVKEALLAQLESLCAADTILASNSSTFPISRSGAALRHPARAIVTHWFNPPQIVPTVEVVPSPATSEATTECALAVLRRLGKLAIPVRREVDGFLVNRVQVAIWREVWSLVDQGIASPADIDAAISGSLGFRLAAIGPLEVNDFGGLDVHSTVFRNLASQISAETEPPPTVQALVDAGHYGTKSGQGFYTYTPEEIARRSALRDARFLTLLKAFYNHAE